MNQAELKIKVNQMRKEQSVRELTTAELDSLTLEELEEEVRMLKISPKINDLWARAQALIKEVESKKK